jgi:hypothetical protein
LRISVIARAIVFEATLLAAACASTPARVALKVPLEIPEPPARVAMDPVPAVIAETPATPLPERPAVTPPARPAGQTSPPPAAAAAGPPAGPPPIAATVEPARPTPPPELRPAGPAGRTPTAAQVLERIVRAKRQLDTIDRRRLNKGKQADYDSARRFLSQGEAAVKDNNLLLAESSVEKAETLANGLR